MNSILTRKAISERKRFAGQDWFYDFRSLTRRFDEASCQKVSQRLLERYAVLTKQWSPELNSEWLCRVFFSAKMIYSATLTLNSCRYAEDHNLRVVMPYLRYYSLLSLMRAVAYMVPEVPWQEGALIKISHEKALLQTFEHLRPFDQENAEKIRAEVLQQKAFRELISYRAPSQGDHHVRGDSDVEGICILLAELAQWMSEIFEKSLLKNADPSTFVFLDEYVEHMSRTEIEGELFMDREDLYRLDYLQRKYPKPPNIHHVMTEGHVEDFFGAWAAKDEVEGDHFNPDADWGLIFDIP